MHQREGRVLRQQMLHDTAKHRKKGSNSLRRSREREESPSSSLLHLSWRPQQAAWVVVALLSHILHPCECRVVYRRHQGGRKTTTKASAVAPLTSSSHWNWHYSHTFLLKRLSGSSQAEEFFLHGQHKWVEKSESCFLCWYIVNSPNSNLAILR